MSFGYECDIPEFYFETFPVAAKSHRCCECKAPILAGEKHLYARGKNDGEFWAARQHMLCRELCMAMRDADDYTECVPFGMLHEAWQDSEYGRNWNRGDAGLLPLRNLYAKILRRERADGTR